MFGSNKVTILYRRIVHLRRRVQILLHIMTLFMSGSLFQKRAKNYCNKITFYFALALVSVVLSIIFTADFLFVFKFTTS